MVVARHDSSIRMRESRLILLILLRYRVIGGEMSRAPAGNTLFRRPASTRRLQADHPPECRGMSASLMLSATSASTVQPSCLRQWFSTRPADTKNRHGAGPRATQPLPFRQPLGFTSHLRSPFSGDLGSQRCPLPLASRTALKNAGLGTRLR